MGLLVNRQNQRSDLQERIAADLQEKAKQAKMREDAALDGVEDIRYLEGTKQTTSLAWVWVLILLLAAGVIAMLMMQG